MDFCQEPFVASMPIEGSVPSMVITIVLPLAKLVTGHKKCSSMLDMYRTAHSTAAIANGAFMVGTHQCYRRGRNSDNALTMSPAMVPGVYLAPGSGTGEHNRLGWDPTSRSNYQTR
jgi:hypothetical protein